MRTLKGIAVGIWLNSTTRFRLRMERMGFGGCISPVKEVSGKSSSIHLHHLFVWHMWRLKAGPMQKERGHLQLRKEAKNNNRGNKE